MSNNIQLTPEQQALLRSMGECDKPELIRRLLRHHGLTQGGLSRKHNLPLPSINLTAMGKRPNPAARAMLAQELGFPEAVLFDPWPSNQLAVSLESEAAA